MCKKDERTKYLKYPRVFEALEKKGFFDMTQEERIRKAMECWGKLYRSGIGDGKAGREALNELRGGGIDDQ